MSNKKAKEEAKVKAAKGPRNFDGILGLLQVFVVVSIAYSTYIVALGTEGYTPKIMLIPQALYASILVIRKFISK
jgi:hypothetical protein